MHELAIAESVVDAFLARTATRSDLGASSGRPTPGVVRDSLEFCFGLAVRRDATRRRCSEIEEPEGAAARRTCATNARGMTCSAL